MDRQQVHPPCVAETLYVGGDAPLHLCADRAGFREQAAVWRRLGPPGLPPGATLHLLRLPGARPDHPSPEPPQSSTDLSLRLSKSRKNIFWNWHGVWEPRGLAWAWTPPGASLSLSSEAAEGTQVEEAPWLTGGASRAREPRFLPTTLWGIREPRWVHTTLQGSGSHAGSHQTLGTQEPALIGVFLFRGRV